MKPAIKVEDLCVDLVTRRQKKRIVDHVKFEVYPGECLGILGESGSGKSMSLKAVLGLLDKNFQVSGQAVFDEKNLIGAPGEELRKLRGNQIGMVLQNPMTCFDPLYRIGSQMAETFAMHTDWNGEKIRSVSLEVLDQMRIHDGAEVLEKYPHQLSGGMLQRIMIGIAMALSPELLIADEPTTALDVTIQAQILELMRELKEKENKSLMLITHDMGVVAEMADDVMVMYAGKEMEYGDVRSIFKDPLHPYTRGLLKSIPRLDQSSDDPLFNIPGSVPDLSEMPKGCRFCTRCPEADKRCREQEPGLYDVNGRQVRCWKYAPEGGQDDVRG